MKKFIAVFLMCFCFCKIYCQNLLNQSSQEILNYFKTENADYQGKMYTQDGVPIMRFSYNKIDRPLVNGLLGSYYYLDEDEKCFMCKMLYTSIDYEDAQVGFFKNNTDFEKIPDRFGWVRKDKKFAVLFENGDDRTFIIIYQKIK